MKINYAAVVASALAYWVLGAVWYGAFSKPFIALMRWTPEQLARMEAEGAGREIGVALLASLLTAYVLAHFVRFTGADTVSKPAQTGFFVRLGLLDAFARSQLI